MADSQDIVTAGNYVTRARQVNTAVYTVQKREVRSASDNGGEHRVGREDVGTATFAAKSQ
jgi:hypothetical protein